MLKLVPSEANRFVPCPGSVAAQVGLPRSPGHPTTEEGKALAWACDRVLMSWHAASPSEPISIHSLIGQSSPAHEGGLILTNEMAYHGSQYLEHIWGKVHAHVEGMQSEKQVSAWQYIEKYNGRLDACFRSPDLKHVDVWDLKYGFGPVSAFENFQLISYGAGMITPETETITLYIFQPRGQSASQPLKEWPLTITEFTKYLQILVDSAAEARGPSPRLVSGKHCRYCKAEATCEVNRRAGWLAMHAAGFEVPHDLTEYELSYELQMMETALQLIKGRYDALEGHAVTRINNGKTVPGYSYREKLSNRAWTRSDEHMHGIGLTYGVEMQSTTVKTLSPNQAQGAGIPRALIDMFTQRFPVTAKLVRDPSDVSRRIFRQ